MAIFSNGWAQHFKSIANDEANKNMKAFTQASAPTMTLAKRVNALVEEINTAVLLVGLNDMVLQTHSLTKFGGMRSCPNVIVGSLIGMGPRAIAVIINHGAAVASTTVIIPAATAIASCKTTKELVALASGSLATASTMALQAMTPAVGTPPRRRGATTTAATTATIPVSTRTTRRGSLAGGAAAPALARPPRSSARRGSEAPPTAEGATNAAATATAVTAMTSDATTAATIGTKGASQLATMQTLKFTSAFIAAPFLRDALFNGGATNPLELIILAREAATNFENRHQGVVGFGNVSASKHVEAFTNWAFAIKLGQLGKVRYLIDPNNKELREFAARRHETCILPPIGGGTSNGTSIATHPGDTTEVFRTLSKGLKRMGEAANETLILKKEEMRLKGEADNLKKDRIKDMHASISNMILMASVTESDWIGTFSNSFKAFYNSKNQGYADLELHHQFDAKDLHNLGFAEGTVLVLWSGLLKRSNPTAPSNCTPFAFRELQPMNMNQKSWSLICTIINQRGGLAQSTEEIKVKAKQEVSAPENYNKMPFQLKAFVS
jgi:hypothetical protein